MLFDGVEGLEGFEEVTLNMLSGGAYSTAPYQPSLCTGVLIFCVEARVRAQPPGRPFTQVSRY